MKCRSGRPGERGNTGETPTARRHSPAQVAAVVSIRVCNTAEQQYFSSGQSGTSARGVGRLVAAGSEQAQLTTDEGREFRQMTVIANSIAANSAPR